MRWTALLTATVATVVLPATAAAAVRNRSVGRHANVNAMMSVVEVTVTSAELANGTAIVVVVGAAPSLGQLLVEATPWGQGPMGWRRPRCRHRSAL